ncbi:hypothetical protein FA95DRAFT_1675432 [Auriscalpium vulgare]|uniref:Uncharacterized protein n=1 Tax=Auriscalpium vulgare TaxID=40419 RepID=A0ACB8S875_9AGAM|nr:hypothetical protein FA95DRAFT_1675432 [Auriscalpium vulgare]
MSGISGTQSPPIEDSEPMGRSSVGGGPVKGVPDREQRAQYFDDAPKGDTKATRSNNLMEAAPTASGPVKDMSSKEMRSALGKEA